MRHLLAAMFFTLLSSTSNAANESPSAYLPFCAELDLAALSDIESASISGQFSGESIASAFFQMMNAREACAAGRVSEAVAIYDDISFE